jgi:2'-5' RNA ligase
MTRPNWFLAWPIDGAFALQAPLPPTGVRRLHPDDLHVTIAFLGGCGEPAAMRALAALDAELAQAPVLPLTVSLGAVVAMGPKRVYSALSALLDRGRSEAEAAIGRLRGDLCAAAGVREDRRPPKAHATLARPRFRATNEQRALGLNWASALDLSNVHLCLDRIALYTWHEPRGLRQFRIVAQRTLAEHAP